MADDLEIHRLLGEIVANQRSFFTEQKRMNTVLEKHFDDDKIQFNGISKRIRAVEQRVNYAAGGVAVVLGVVTLFWQTILTGLRGGA